ncbi:MAG: hypothetical protein AB7D03_06425 [Thiomicrospira sp.]
MKISVIGMNPLGLAQALAWAQYHQVSFYTPDAHWSAALNQKQSPIARSDFATFIAQTPLSLQTVSDLDAALQTADWVLLAEEARRSESSKLDTQTLEQVITKLATLNPQAVAIVTTPVPVGFCQRMQSLFVSLKLMVAPALVKRDAELEGVLYPSRIVVGERSDLAQSYAQACLKLARRAAVPVLLTEADEAESIQLFSNDYWSVRRLFKRARDMTRSPVQRAPSTALLRGVRFNLADSPVEEQIKAMLNSQRRQMSPLFNTILSAQQLMRDYIVEQVLARRPLVVGLYRLVLKQADEAENVYASYAHGVIKRLQAQNVKVLIYEPSLDAEAFFSAEVVKDIGWFNGCCDVIVSVAHTEELDDVGEKVLALASLNDSAVR